jgi:hypothetical protein
VTIETDELVAWPPVRIQVDPDGSGWVDVAGTRTALSCEDLAAARAAAVAQVVRTAGLLGRPVTATATGPEGQAVVVVQPDGTVRDATPVRRRRWLGRRLAPTAGLSWEGTSREVPPTGPATCPPASPPVLEEPEPLVVVDDRGPVDVVGPSLVSIAPPVLEEETPPASTPVDVVDEPAPVARRPRRGRRILASVLVVALIAAATAGAVVWTAGERRAAGARDATARQAAAAQLTTERAALATVLDQAASLLEDAAGQVCDSSTKDTLAAAAAAGRSEEEQASGDAGDAASLTASATKVHDAAAAISSAASAFEAARDALWTSWAGLAASLSAAADDGQHLVDATAGQVLDDSTRQALSKDVEGARTLLTAASGRQLGPAAAASQASTLRAAIASDSTSVNDSHTAWQSDQASQAAAAAAAAAASGSTSTKPPAKSGGTTSTSKPPSSTTSTAPADPPPASTGGRVTHLSASASSGVGTAAFTVSVSTNGPTSVSVSVRLGSTSIPMSGPGSVDGTGTFTGSVSGLAAGTYSWIVSAGGMTTSGSLEVS